MRVIILIFLCDMHGSEASVYIHKTDMLHVLDVQSNV